LTIRSHHALLCDDAPASAGAPQPYSCHGSHAPAGRRTNFRTAVAESLYLVAVGDRARLRLYLVTGVAHGDGKAAFGTMRKLFGMSPAITICADEMFRSLDRVATTVPLSACGWSRRDSTAASAPRSPSHPGCSASPSLSRRPDPERRRAQRTSPCPPSRRP